MELIDVRVYLGPSVYSHKPVVRLEIKLGDYVDVPTNEIDGLNEYIIKSFPGLRDHKCSPGYPGGFLERLKKGTYLAHVIEHLSIEIQRMLGYNVNFGKARHKKDDVYTVIYACVNPTVGKACGMAVINIISSLIKGEWVDFNNILGKLRLLHNKYSFGPSTRAIIEEAEKRDIPVNEIGNSGMIRLGYGKYQKYISATMYEDTKCISVDISCDKSITKAILDEVNIPVPQGSICHCPEEALNLAAKLGYPLVVKPNRGNQGKFVSMNIMNKEDLLTAYSQVRDNYDEVLIERHIKGKDYRLLVVGGKLVAAAERIPPKIIGDGVHSISDLVDKMNMDELRGEDHEKPLTKIVIDEASRKLLRKQGFDLQSVPDKSQVVWLRENGNISTGGVATDCTDKVHPINREMAELAAKTIGLDIAGIDIVMPDISVPLKRGNGAIVEVNASPGIRMHLHPSKGKPRDVAGAIIDMIYPKGSLYSIPIVSVTGTNGKTTTVRMLSHMLRNCGLTVGMTTTHGIYINEKCIESGDTTGPRSARRILNDREVDAAVLETARGGILNGGLGYKQADIAIFTNLTGDHIGFNGIDDMDDLLHVKSLVIEAVKEKGTCVLNADDDYVMQVVDKAGGKVLLISVNPDNQYIKNHITDGGCAIYTDGESIYLNHKDKKKEIIRIHDIPSTFNGALGHNVYNSMSAIAGAYALGVPITIIRRSLKGFKNDSTYNPGRFNMYSLNGTRIILDYGHNIDGYRAVIEGVKCLSNGRIVGIIGAPGNRRDQDIIALGEISAKSFDELIIKEDLNLRRRKPLEVANLLKKGALREGFVENRIKIIADEVEALKTAIDEAKDGDTVLMFFEDLDRVTTLLKNYGALEYEEIKNSRVALTV